MGSQQEKERKKSMQLREGRREETTIFYLGKGTAGYLERSQRGDGVTYRHHG